MTCEPRWPVVVSDGGLTFHADPSLDGEGVVVESWEQDDRRQSVRRYYAYAGGAWLLNRDGTVAAQIHGELDVCCPRDDVERFVRGLLTEELNR